MLLRIILGGRSSRTCAEKLYSLNLATRRVALTLSLESSRTYVKHATSNAFISAVSLATEPAQNQETNQLTKVKPFSRWAVDC